MDVGLTQSQTSAIDNIARKEGISCYKTCIKPATVEGDGYSGSLMSITIQGETKVVHLILKVAEQSENTLLKIFRRKTYLREIFLYSVVLPEFKNFQIENYVHNGFNSFAKFYASNDEENGEFLILQDLREVGYKMWNRKIPMNDHHVALIFTEYAKLHAIALTMKEKRPDRYGELVRDLGDFYCGSLPREEISLTIKYKLQTGFNAVNGKGAVAEAFKRFATVAEKFLIDDLENVEDQLVVTHSDCWCNNFLFNYQNADCNIPQKVCFLDWQLSKMGSPVLDLSYFFFVCTWGDMFQHYRKYLDIYHKTVCEILEHFSCDPKKLFPYELLDYHWKKYAKYGLYALLMTVNIMLLDTDDLNSEENEGLGMFEVSNERNRRIVEVVDFMAQNGLIQ